MKIFGNWLQNPINFSPPQAIFFEKLTNFGSFGTKFHFSRVRSFFQEFSRSFPEWFFFQEFSRFSRFSRFGVNHGLGASISSKKNRGASPPSPHQGLFPWTPLAAERPFTVYLPIQIRSSTRIIKVDIFAFSKKMCWQKIFTNAMLKRNSELHLNDLNCLRNLQIKSSRMA